ncbi:MAG TPA: hemolysin family protein [Longimicrobiales bacterium]|nr:hemolysin family protein [Longimicrobiales bacterium]
MSIVLVELVAILAIIAVNGLLAGAEIAVVSSREARLARRSEEGSEGAARALAMLRSPNRFLSTVQVGITAVAVATGVFGGVRIAARLSESLGRVGLSPGAAGSVAAALVFILLTFVMLVFGELVPKRIALRNPEELASRLAAPMDRLSAVSAPLVRLLSGATDLVLRLLPLPAPSREEVSEEEIQAMIAHATEAGILDAAEQEIVGQLFHLSDQTVGRVMTPGEKIVWLDVGEGPERWGEKMGEVLHTRYVVADGSPERMLGYVKVQDLFRRCAAGKPFELRPVLRKPHFVPESMPAFRLLELFQWSGHHIAIVTGPDETVKGLVTFHDVLEGIVGEIPKDHEVDRPTVVRRDDGTLLVDGLLPFDELLTEIGMEGGEGERWDTVHSFVVESLEESPGTTSVLLWRGLRIEVVDMDGRRVDKVLISK